MGVLTRALRPRCTSLFMLLRQSSLCFFNDTATTEIYTYGHTLSLHDALPIYQFESLNEDVAFDTTAADGAFEKFRRRGSPEGIPPAERSEEHTSELQSLMRISYAVFCLKKKI